MLAIENLDNKDTATHRSMHSKLGEIEAHDIGGRRKHLYGVYR